MSGDANSAGTTGGNAGASATGGAAGGAGAGGDATNVLTGGAQGGAGGTSQQNATQQQQSTQQTDTAKAEADKAAAAKAEAAAADKAWSEFKPKAPEGVTLDEAGVKEFVPFAREAGLNPEQAQKLIEFDLKRGQARDAAAAKVRDGWVKELRDDKEFGGAKFDENVKLSRQAIELAEKKFPGVKAAIDAAGLQNFPALARVFAYFGGALAEDSIGGVRRSERTPVNDDAAFHAALYPNTTFSNGAS